MLFKYPLVSQHNLQKLNRKLAASVKTPSMKVVPASLPTSKKTQIRLKTRLKTRFVPAEAWLPFPKLCARQSSVPDNKGGIRSPGRNQHLHSFLKVKDKFSSLPQPQTVIQPTNQPLKTVLLCGFSHLLNKFCLFWGYHKPLNSLL